MDTIFFPTVPTGVTQSLWDNSNIDGAKVSSFYSQPDTQRVTEFNIASPPQLPEPITQSFDRMKKSTLGSREAYQQNWFWCDSWDGLAFTENDNLELGIPLDNEIQYCLYQCSSCWLDLLHVQSNSKNPLCERKCCWVTSRRFSN